MRLPVKVCGITQPEDAFAAIGCGAQALGFIFYRESPRYVAPEAVATFRRALPPFVVTVGVFVNATAEEINHVTQVAGLDRVQLHGGEPPELMEQLARPAYRAFRMRQESDVQTVLAALDRTVLLDTHIASQHGGTGTSFDWAWARRIGARKRVILAGGLAAENVEQAIVAARPAALDVSSGVESAPGIKDPRKLEAFFRALDAIPDLPPTRAERRHAGASQD